MQIKDFQSEKWMTDYERKAIYNLTDTSTDSWTFEELFALDPTALQNLDLDYGWITGDPALRKEILSLYQNQQEETLTLCCGASQGNELVMSLLLNPNDHVIAFSPGYQQFWDFPKWLQATSTLVPLNKDDWSIDFDAFQQAIRPETKLLLLANPHNPTGTWLDQGTLEKLIAICREKGIWILCDEVYRDPEGVDPSLSDLYEKGVSTGSLSKQYGLAGLRTGWIKGPTSLIQDINTFRDYAMISTGPLTERLGAIALRHRKTLSKRSQEIMVQNKEIVAQWLEKNPYFSCAIPTRGPVGLLKLPEGLSSKQFALDLLEETGIFFVPGSCFGLDGYVRLAFGKSHANLSDVLKRLNAFMDTYIQK